jgi:hypothetical protein
MRKLITLLLNYIALNSLMLGRRSRMGARWFREPSSKARLSWATGAGGGLGSAAVTLMAERRVRVIDDTLGA